MATQPLCGATVVVPVRNGEETIAQCLSALVAQDVPSEDYEVIVVDDGSRDNTARIVQQFAAVRLIQQPPRGPAAARNRGIEEARCRLVLFTDADCCPKSDWVRQLVSALERTDAAGAKGIYATRQRSLVARFVQVEYETKCRRLAKADSIDFIDTYSAAYLRSVLQEVGGFDERFTLPSCEDQELSFRVAERGYRLIYVPAAVVDHQHADSVGAYARKKYRIGYWKALVLARHPAKIGRDAHTPQSLKLQMALTGLLGLAFPFALFMPSLARPTLILALALVGSWMPFLGYTARRDPPVLLVAPMLLLVRAVALSIGLLWGARRFRGHGSDGPRQGSP